MVRYHLRSMRTTTLFRHTVDWFEVEVLLMRENKRFMESTHTIRLALQLHTEARYRDNKPHWHALDHGAVSFPKDYNCLIKSKAQRKSPTFTRLSLTQVLHLCQCHTYPTHIAKIVR